MRINSNLYRQNNTSNSQSNLMAGSQYSNLFGDNSSSNTSNIFENLFNYKSEHHHKTDSTPSSSTSTTNSSPTSSTQPDLVVNPYGNDGKTDKNTAFQNYQKNAKVIDGLSDDKIKAITNDFLTEVPEIASTFANNKPTTIDEMKNFIDSYMGCGPNDQVGKECVGIANREILGQKQPDLVVNPFGDDGKTDKNMAFQNYQKNAKVIDGLSDDKIKSITNDLLTEVPEIASLFSNSKPTTIDEMKNFIDSYMGCSPNDQVGKESVGIVNRDILENL